MVPLTLGYLQAKWSTITTIIFTLKGVAYWVSKYKGFFSFMPNINTMGEKNASTKCETKEMENKSNLDFACRTIDKPRSFPGFKTAT